MKLFYFINGINADAQDHARNWHSRAARWVENHELGVADHHSYHIPTAGRWRLQDSVVENLYQCLADRLWKTLTLVGHSNGCQVLCELLRRHRNIECDHLHLIAGACDASFETNGLNTAIHFGQVRRVTVYHSLADRALKLAWYTRWIPFLGYGSLGWKGPTRMSETAKILTRVEDCTPLGHSDYFVGERFERLMAVVTG